MCVDADGNNKIVLNLEFHFSDPFFCDQFFFLFLQPKIFYRLHRSMIAISYFAFSIQQIINHQSDILRIFFRIEQPQLLEYSHEIVEEYGVRNR